MEEKLLACFRLEFNSDKQIECAECRNCEEYVDLTAGVEEGLTAHVEACGVSAGELQAVYAYHRRQVSYQQAAGRIDRKPK